MKHYQRYRKHGDPTRTENAPRGSSLEERILFHGWTVDQNGCWIWNGCKDGWGYGQVSDGTRAWGTHRAVYVLWVGPLEDTQIVLHSCDNPPCMNPDHLSAGTHADNSRDRDTRGRSGSAKMSVEQVREIREIRSSSKLTIQQIADAYNLSRDGVAAIIYRKVWKDV